jgi:hypothetical protein
MRCFYHHDRDAVGSCKSCGKGLCPECAVELKKGLACRGRCEAEVTALIDLIDRNMRLEPTTTRARLAGAFFFLACGAVFLIFGLMSGREFDFATVLGGFFIAYGLFVFWWLRRISVRSRKTEA